MSTPTVQLLYRGDRRVQASHVQSGVVIHTDAPTDNRGLGRSFSPTDLLATSVASCVVTVASLIATKEGVDIGEVTVDVYKTMASSPRRLARLKLIVGVPPGTPTAALSVLGARIRDTPVARSLASEVEIRVDIVESAT